MKKAITAFYIMTVLACSVCFAEIGADGNWCDSNYLDPEDMNFVGNNTMLPARLMIVRVIGTLYLTVWPVGFVWGWVLVGQVRRKNKFFYFSGKVRKFFRI